MKRQIAICIIIAGLSALFVLSASGCTPGRHQPEPISYYVLHYNPPGKSLPSGIKDPVIVHVKRLEAPAPYNTNHMIYAENPYHRARYAYHQWMAKPADMLTGLLVRDIQSAGATDAASASTSRRDATLRVEGGIIDFYEDDEKHQWEAVLTIRLALVHIRDAGRQERTLFMSTYAERVVLEKNNPHSLARSMSKAMEAVSGQFMADMAESLQQKVP